MILGSVASYYNMNPSLSGVTIVLVATMIFSTLPESLQQLSLDPTSDGIGRGSNFNISKNSGDSVYPAVAASGNNVYVVWQDDYLGQSVSYDEKNYDIHFTRSMDGGKSFQNSTNLSNNVMLSGRPIIAAFDKNVYVAWIEDTPKEKQIWFRKSTNSGNTFDTPINLAMVHYPQDYLIRMDIAAFGNDVYVVWRDLDDHGKNGSILLRSSTDGGDTFGETNKISNNAIVWSSPKVAAFDKNVYVVWDVIRFPEEKTNSGEGIFLVKSSDGGGTFKNATKLNGNYEFGEAEVAAHSNRVYVAWAGSVYNSKESIGDVFLIVSFNNGNTFTKTTLINKDFMDSENVELAATNGRIDAVWQDRVTGNGEIYFKGSLNNSNEPTFLEDARNLSSTEGLSECPSIAIVGKTSYVTWEDNTNGNHEIFFKKLVFL